MDKYEMRFKLQEKNMKTVDINSLTDFYKNQLEELLSIINLYSDNKKVNFDSFSFVNNPQERFKLYE